MRNAIKARRKKKRLVEHIDSVVVPIYHSKIKRKQGIYHRYTVIKGRGRTRRRIQRSNLDAARTIARDYATSLLNADTAHTRVPAARAAAVERAASRVEALGLHFEDFLSEAVAAQELLGGRVRLTDPARDHARRARVPAVLVTEALAALLKAKRAEGLSDRHTDDLASRLTRFADKFQCHLAEIRAEDITQWLDGRGLSMRTRNNDREAVRTLFKFCKARKWLPSDWDELDQIAKAKVAPGKKSVYTPAEIQTLLDAAWFDERPSVTALVPWLAVRAFAGVRESETRGARFDWSSIHLENGWIILEGEKTKTGAARRIHLQDNLAAWLKPYARSSGPLYPFANPTNVYTVLRHECGIKILHNALRDSFQTYRHAATHDLALVADESGNNPRQVKDSYSSLRTHDGTLVTPDLAAQWFAIRPTGQKVLPLFG